MCMTDERVTERLREGIVIDAPFPKNMELAYEVLVKEGQFDAQCDFLHIIEQFDNQFTTVKYNKYTPFIHPKTNEKFETRHFSITVPDRYIPTSKVDKLPEGVIRNKEDI